MNPRSTSLWNFSLTVYGEAVVAEACLELQNKHGADVNLVLFVLWHAVAGHRLSEAEIGDTVRITARWRDEVVRPLRRVRQTLKVSDDHWPPSATEELRTRIKADELEAERLQQRMLEEAYPIGSIGRAESCTTSLAANLKTYARLIGSPFPEQLSSRLCDAVLAKFR